MPSAADQLKLLELQGLDNKLQDLRHRKTTDPTIAKVAENTQVLTELQTKLLQAQVAIGDLDREVTKAQTAVNEVQARIVRNQKHIDSGELRNYKDEVAVTEEMGILVTRLASLEDDLLAALERQEACLTAEAQIDTAITEMKSAVLGAEQDRDDALAAIVAEGRAVIAERDKLVSTCDPALVTRYDTIRKRLGGVAAVRLWGGKCEGCQMQLPPGDLETALKAPDSQVVLCEECGRILVRVPQ